MNNPAIVGAIEIGTAKTVVLVGELVPGHALNIIGMSSLRSKGVKKGEIIDFKAASACVHQALKEAEESAKAQIEYVYLAHTGSQLRGYLNSGLVNVSASNNIVSRLDIKRVEENAKSKELPTDCVYIHHVKNAYKLDGRCVADPYMMEGERLEVSYWSIHTDFKKVRDPIHIINGFSLRVEGIVASSIASGSIVSSAIEKKNGVLILDIGCGTTDYIIYKDGYIVRTGVIPIGGDHITNDLSLGLRISLEAAESLKQSHASLLTPSLEEEGNPIILTESSSSLARKIPRDAVYKITHARVQELIHILSQQIEPWLSNQQIAGGVIVTGGSSRIKGLTQLIGSQLGLSARLSQNPSWASQALQEPEFSTSLGLLNHALQDQSSNSLDASIQTTSLFGKMAKLFT